METYCIEQRDAYIILISLYQGVYTLLPDCVVVNASELPSHIDRKDNFITKIAKNRYHCIPHYHSSNSLDTLGVL